MSTVHDTLKLVADVYAVSVADIQGRSRKQNVMLARHAATYVLFEELYLPHRTCAALTGRADHSSSIHSVQTACDWLHYALPQSHQLKVVLNRMDQDINQRKRTFA